MDAISEKKLVNRRDLHLRDDYKSTYNSAKKYKSTIFMG